MRHAFAVGVQPQVHSKDQYDVRLNDAGGWVDVEADEFTLRKTMVDGRMVWLSYLGLARRGFPSTLVILQLLESRVTKKRAPGPGPLRKAEWTKVGAKYVDGQRLILHTDSAKAYNEPFAEMKHTRVVHMPKNVDGQWVRPRSLKR
eukprot:3835895-Amphidinium_carterae.3